MTFFFHGPFSVFLSLVSYAVCVCVCAFSVFIFRFFFSIRLFILRDFSSIFPMPRLVVSLQSFCYCRLPDLIVLVHREFFSQMQCEHTKFLLRFSFHSLFSISFASPNRMSNSKKFLHHSIKVFLSPFLSLSENLCVCLSRGLCMGYNKPTYF